MTVNLDLICLEADQTSRTVGKYINTIWPIKQVFLKQTDKLKISSKEYIQEITSSVVACTNNALTLYGTGNLHHYTYGLVTNVAKKINKEIAYIHIDQHTDDSWPGAEYLGCGSFVGQLALEHNIEAVCYIGCEQIMNLEPKGLILKNKEINEKGVRKSLQETLKDTPEDVYVTIDLDVLLKNEMLTRWETGKMSINTLIEIIHFLKNNKNIISADILGHGSYSVPADVDDQPNLNHELLKKINKTNMLVYAITTGTFLGKNVDIFREQHLILSEQNLHKYLNQ